VPRVQVICFVATASTRGEAQSSAASPATGTSRRSTSSRRGSRLPRRIVISRCYRGRLRMVGAPQVNWKLPWDAVTETAKLVYQEAFARGC